ncbi:MAG: C25 family peptidase C-terminal domain-containing protein, partial [Candidatus Stygibacter frigidus]|nr:C25 family peptidase C-terminal domain-containing protein [Candidatus Stygibacter frigidus]
MNQYSHEYNVSMMQGDSNYRWACYETNLFGDPSMDIWTAEPVDMVINYPVSLPIGIYQIQITSDTENARIALIQDGELIGRGITDATGTANIETFEPLSSPGLISVSAIAHNKNRFQGNIVIATDQAYIVMQALEIDDVTGNNNGLLDYGETADLNLSLNNVGNQVADSVTVTIFTFNQYLNIVNSTVYCGDINGDSIIEFDGAFSIEISDEVTDQQT